MLKELMDGERMEFRPFVPDIGFRRPLSDDPRARKLRLTRLTTPRNSRHTERMCTEKSNIRDDFSLLT